MTEKEKQLAGLLHNANYDAQLQKEMKECKAKCFVYNQTNPLDEEKKAVLLQQLFGKVGKDAVILSPFHCDYGYRIEVGEHFFMNHGCVILDGAKVRFGDNVFVAPNCGFYAAGHPIDTQRRNEGLEYAYPITIGNHVWIGGGVQILPGVTIGDHVVIGAGSVVNKDIPSHVVAAGNPCKIIREISEDDVMKQY